MPDQLPLLCSHRRPRQGLKYSITLTGTTRPMDMPSIGPASYHSFHCLDMVAKRALPVNTPFENVVTRLKVDQTLIGLTYGDSMMPPPTVHK